MEPLASQHLPEYPTRFQGVKLPASRMQIRDIDSVILVVEHGPLADVTTNLLAAAALCRSIAIERGEAPSLKVLGEVQLSNSLQGHGSKVFGKGVSAGDHALLLTSASLYKRQMASMIGTYALAGAILDGFPHLVDDDVPLGRRKDPRLPILGFVESLLKDVTDTHVRRLLELSRASERTQGGDSTVEMCRGALTTLQTVSFPLFRDGNRERPEVIPTLHNMIVEWRDGAVLPSVCRPFIEQHKEALEIAQSIWSGATEIAKGAFQLIEFPYEETDDVVQHQLREIYRADQRATYVIEKGADRSSTALTYDEAISFERRHGAGEDPQTILNEVEELLRSRNDSSCLTDIAIGEMRERDPKDTLERILTKAQYIPDPSGFQYTLLKHPQGGWHELLAEHNIPLITHNSLWLSDVTSGKARPFSLSFQAQYLDRFISMVE